MSPVCHTDMYHCCQSSLLTIFKMVLKIYIKDIYKRCIQPLFQGFHWARIVLMSRKVGSINKLRTHGLFPLTLYGFFFPMLMELKRQFLYLNEL